MCFLHFTFGLLAGTRIYKEVRRKDVWRKKSGNCFERATGSPCLCFGRWVRCYFLSENLKCVLCSWGNLPEPQRTKLDLRWGSDSLGNLAGVTSLVHGLDGRPRKGTVLALHSPDLLGQGCVKFPSRSHVGHAGKNWSWILPTWRVTEGEEVPQTETEGKALSGHLQDKRSYRKKVAFSTLQVLPPKEARAGSHLPSRMVPCFGHFTI